MKNIAYFKIQHPMNPVDNYSPDQRGDPSVKLDCVSCSRYILGQPHMHARLSWLGFFFIIKRKNCSVPKGGEQPDSDFALVKRTIPKLHTIHFAKVTRHKKSIARLKFWRFLTLGANNTLMLSNVWNEGQDSEPSTETFGYCPYIFTTISCSTQVVSTSQTCPSKFWNRKLTNLGIAKTRRWHQRGA